MWNANTCIILYNKKWIEKKLFSIFYLFFFFLLWFDYETNVIFVVLTVWLLAAKIIKVG